MNDQADVSAPIHPLLSERWSPRAFAQREVPTETLVSLFEAARWAPSCFNAQPWTYLVATRADAEGHGRFGSCLVEGNAWAQAAPVLICAVAQGAFEYNGKPNAWAWHDLGLASMSLVVQAQSEGLACHQMAGFDPVRTRVELAIPEGWTPAAFIALGYEGDASSLPEDLAKGEAAPRKRKALSAVMQGTTWGIQVTSSADPRVQRILATVDSIPPGKVATYGQVAEEAGLPGRARMVGSILRKVAAEQLPWHRVLGAGGYLRVPGRALREQTQRLRAEGVTVTRGRVNLATHRWE